MALSSAKAPTTAKKMKTKRAKLSSAELSHRAAQRAFARQVRTIFLKCGYQRIVEAADKEFKFDHITSDFDDIFVRENVIVFCEHTLTKESNVGDHFKNKAHIYNHVFANRQRFTAYIRSKFPATDKAIPASYHESEIRIAILYCSKSEVKADHKSLSSDSKFLWYGSIKYFKSIADTVRLSARYELHEFLGIPFSEVGDDGKLPQAGATSKFSGSLLPEAHSNFPKDFKVVSFYASPGALLSRAYVLRKDGWKDDTGLYQRMIDKSKVENIRKYLKREQRTFVNNVIVTLPDATKLIDTNGDTVNPSIISKTTPIDIQIPLIANSIGIVDGQHRIFSYYEDVNEPPDIRTYRDRQNLLATGILYPANFSSAERSKFEAALFLEINSTQNAAKSDLKQAIAVITAPFSPDSIGKRVVARMGTTGPLEGFMERHFFDKGVLKTTSIVSYGLRPLVRIDGEESLFNLWESSEKEKVRSRDDVDALLSYVAFCVSEINIFLGAARAVLGNNAWAIKSKDGEGLLAVTSLNGLLILFRKVVATGGLKSFDNYRASLKDLPKVDFTLYRSSQYNRMADDIIATIYKR